jgi:hypothetical protein
MGVHNVAAALRVPKVSDRAAMVLVAMALHALDDPAGEIPARHYTGGRALLCTTLGDWPDEAGLHKIRRAVAELEDAGFIVRDGSWGRGHAQRWWLCLPGMPDPPGVHSPVDN